MRLGVLLVLGACYSPAGEQPCTISCASDSDCPGDFACERNSCTLRGSTCGDGGIAVFDAPIPDAPILDDGCAGLPNGLLPRTCLDPTAPMTLPALINTDNTGPCDLTIIPGMCVIAATAIVVPATSVTGTHPLVLWSSTKIEVTGTLDVSSHIFGGQTGPGRGATAASCPAVDGVIDTDGAESIGSGGSGGTNSSTGGLGGTGRDGTDKAVATNQATQILEIALRGGCDGGGGGVTGVDSGGAGGGAVYLMAHDSITVTGRILAGGAGGLGGTEGTGGGNLGGGGGGGAGGLIAFDTPMLSLDGATLNALGGGGGGGTGRVIVNSMPIVLVGNNGNDPMPTAPALGGNQRTSNNGGGNGSPLDGGLAPNGGDVMAVAVGGGGGGGGGAGFIVRYGVPVPGGQPSSSFPAIIQK